jgi:hypothetical protein
MKLNISMGDAVEILKLLDQNSNFLVEQDEITRIFGTQIQLSNIGGNYAHSF